MIEQLIATIESVIPDPQVDTPYVDPQVVAQAVMGLLAEQPVIPVWFCGTHQRAADYISTDKKGRTRRTCMGGATDCSVDLAARYALVRLEDAPAFRELSDSEAAAEEATWD